MSLTYLTDTRFEGKMTINLFWLNLENTNKLLLPEVFALTDDMP